MLDRKVWVIWNKKDDRPAIVNVNYGMMSVYLTEEQAQAYLAGGSDSNLIIKVMNLTNREWTP